MDLRTTDNDGYAWRFDADIPNDERRFYIKAYPNFNKIIERKIHCTVCQEHIGTAPAQESVVRIHPILRVTHCDKCHEFYSSVNFIKGKDGSELMCRWCAQGGQVYCCSKCTYVFCKSCIISNLPIRVLNDIEGYGNWNCFSCAPKIIWPLRAKHWVLINYIQKQKNIIMSGNHTDLEMKKLMVNDTSGCCGGKLKLKLSEGKQSEKSIYTLPKEHCIDESHHPIKKIKLSNTIACTPKKWPMLEPIRNPLKSPKNVTLKPNTYVLTNDHLHAASTSKRSPQEIYRPPLVSIPVSVNCKTISSTKPQTSVAYTIKDAYRLPSSRNSIKTVQPVSKKALLPILRNNYSNVFYLNPQKIFKKKMEPMSTINKTQAPTKLRQLGFQCSQSQSVLTMPQQVCAARYARQKNSNPNLRKVIINTPLPSSGGSIRQQYGQNAIERIRLECHVVNTLDICLHINEEIQSFTNTNAFKNVHNNSEINKLYMHLNDLLHNGIDRVKKLQNKLIADIRSLGFNIDADNLENGKLATGKQANDNEDGEIKIIEPHCDIINLDSDDEELELVVKKTK